MNIVIRPEQPTDYADIQSINDAAFGQKNEGTMIQELRKTPRYDARFSLVAEKNRILVGHILFYPVDIVTNQGKQTVLSLAPVAVLPAYQNQGIGGQLVKKGMKAASQAGYSAIIVVGHPAYYPRFGFQKASTWKIRVPFEVPDEAFLAVELKENALHACGGLVEVPPAYYDAL